jgi:hypothetical protein
MSVMALIEQLERGYVSPARRSCELLVGGTPVHTTR